MNRHLSLIVALAALLSLCPRLHAEDKAAPKVKPLKILFITGGGYHDYRRQAPYLKEKLSERANVEIKLVDGGKDSHAVPELFADPKFGEDYDAVIYDLCYATDSKPIDPKLYEKIFEVTKAGKPAILIHCAMHCFRPAADWAQFAGMRTNHHEKFGPFAVRPADKDNAITAGWPQDWNTSGDEQYVTEEVYPDTVKLLISTGVNEKAAHPENVVAWEHQYGQGRVFGTTLGHDMKTISDPHYLQMLANGVLWACDKLDDKGNPKPGYAGTGPKAETIEKK